MDQAARLSLPAPALVVSNPATGARIAEIPAARPEDVATAIERARRVQAAWGARSFRDRAACLRRLARRLLDDPELVPTIVAESGKPRYEAEGIEVFYTCELTRFLSGRAGRRALRDDVRSPLIFANKRARVTYHPHGVVGVLGPWNWPLLNNYADCVAPLLAGNAVILKPSPLTPLTSLRVLRLWREAGLPEDVLQVLPGGADVGEALVEAADMIFFTGSERAGRRVAARCGERLVPSVLELGGKSPMIVLADADLEAAARAAVWSAFSNSGQVCIRTERVLVEEPAVEPFIALCQARLSELRQGPDSGREVRADIDVGAVTFAAQVTRVEEQIAEAVARGARLVAGGRRRPELGGCFFEPTLLGGVTAQMAVAREETFGPLLPVLSVRDAEEALRICNEGGRGLSGSVWSRDARRASALARRLEAGSVCVNDVLVNYFCVEAPLGGVKGSGLGFRHGPEALRQFCRIETIIEDRPLLRPLGAWIGRQLMFPYQTRVLRALRWVMRRLY